MPYQNNQKGWKFGQIVDYRPATREFGIGSRRFGTATATTTQWVHLEQSPLEAYTAHHRGLRRSKTIERDLVPPSAFEHTLSPITTRPARRQQAIHAESLASARCGLPPIRTFQLPLSPEHSIGEGSSSEFDGPPYILVENHGHEFAETVNSKSTPRLWTDEVSAQA